MITEAREIIDEHTKALKGSIDALINEAEETQRRYDAVIDRLIDALNYDDEFGEKYYSFDARFHTLRSRILSILNTSDDDLSKPDKKR